MNPTSDRPTPEQRSVVLRCLRWFFRWRTIRVILFGLFCLGTLLFLLEAEENWRGKRAWERFRLEWEAKGERFDLASVIPKPVPAEQNFALTPFLAPLLDYEFVNGAVRWRDSNGLARAKSVTVAGKDTYRSALPGFGSWQRGEACDLKAWQAFYRANPEFPASPQPQEPARDVLFALQKHEPVLAELRAASQRPHAVFPLHYGETFFSQLEHLSVLKALIQVTTLHALANLDAGQSDAALADTKLAFHFARALQSEPMLISQLVRIALIQVSMQPVWEGLARHRWTEAQLEELQKTLASFQLLEDYGVAMRGERAFSLEVMAQWRTGRAAAVASENGAGINPPVSLMPRGWLYQNQLAIARLHQEITLPTVDAARHRVYPEKCDDKFLAAALGRRSLYNIFARQLFPAIQKSAMKFAQSQTAIDLAAVACALERHRLAEGRYPETLAAVAPRFLDKLPPDVISGQLLHYRLDDAGQPVIYSVGWNGTDDGGTVGLNNSTPPGIDATKGDWIWSYSSR